MIGAVVLAAGQGQRLGACAKACLPWAQGTALEAVHRTLREAGVGPVVVVVAAPFEAEVRARHPQLDVAWVVNPAPARGMASSVEHGFAALAEEASLRGALLWPVDAPAVAPSTVRALLDAVGEAGLVVPVLADGRRGHPVRIDRRWWPRLTVAGLPGGVRGLYREVAPAPVVVDDPGIVCDLDTAEDLRRWDVVAPEGRA